MGVLGVPGGQGVTWATYKVFNGFRGVLIRVIDLQDFLVGVRRLSRMSLPPVRLIFFGTVGCKSRSRRWFCLLLSP